MKKGKIKIINVIKVFLIFAISIFIVYNVFGGDITDKTHSKLIFSGYCRGKFRITNEEELTAFKAITYNMDDFKYDLTTNDIFVDINNNCACPQGVYVKNVKVNNFVTIKYDIYNTTCASISAYGVMTVVPKNTLWHAYTGNWNNPIDVLNNLDTKKHSILKGYYCTDDI